MKITIEELNDGHGGVLVEGAGHWVRYGTEPYEWNGVHYPAVTVADLMNDFAKRASDTIASNAGPDCE